MMSFGRFLAIGVIEKDILVRITAGGDVIHRAWIFDPQWSSHTKESTSSSVGLQDLTLSFCCYPVTFYLLLWQFCY